MLKKKKKLIFAGILVLIGSLYLHAQQLSGTITDKVTGKTLQSALIGIISDSLRVVSDSTGRFTLNYSSAALKPVISTSPGSSAPVFRSGSVQFSISSVQNVSIEQYSLDGKKVKSLLSRQLQPGSYSINVAGKTAVNSGLYLTKITINGQTYNLKTPSLVSNTYNNITYASFHSTKNETGNIKGLGKVKTVPDTLTVSRFGYKTVKLSLDSNLQNISVALDTAKLFVFVEGGTFQQGNSDTSVSANQRPVHSVTLSSYYVNKYHVTFNEYDAFSLATGHPIAVDKRKYGRGSTPARGVTWYDALLFANWQSKQDGLAPVYTIDSLTVDTNNVDTTTGAKKWSVSVDWTANGYRLLTEAEWEYAARGGKYTHGYKFSGSDSLRAVAWTGYDTLSDGSYLGAQSVGTKLPNELGIYDLSGNVHQYVWDKSLSKNKNVNYPDSAVTNPTGITGKYDRVVVRGAGYMAAEECNLVTARHFKKLNTVDYYGIRLGRSN